MEEDTCVSKVFDMQAVFETFDMQAVFETDSFRDRIRGHGLILEPFEGIGRRHA